MDDMIDYDPLEEWYELIEAEPARPPWLLVVGVSFFSALFLFMLGWWATVLFCAFVLGVMP